MSTKSKAKGTAAETVAVRYLMEAFPACERRTLSGSKDRGDIAGVPHTVGEVKAAVKIELRKWQQETLTEMENAGEPNCFLLIKVPYKSVAKWDFWIPAYQVGLENMTLATADELMGCRWIHMDFELGRDVLLRINSALGLSARF